MASVDVNDLIRMSIKRRDDAIVRAREEHAYFLSTLREMIPNGVPDEGRPLLLGRTGDPGRGNKGRLQAGSMRSRLLAALEKLGTGTSKDLAKEAGLEGYPNASVALADAPHVKIDKSNKRQYVYTWTKKE